MRPTGEAWRVTRDPRFRPRIGVRGDVPASERRCGGFRFSRRSPDHPDADRRSGSGMTGVWWGSGCRRHTDVDSSTALRMTFGGSGTTGVWSGSLDSRTTWNLSRERVRGDVPASERRCGGFRFSRRSPVGVGDDGCVVGIRVSPSHGRRFFDCAQNDIWGVGDDGCVVGFPRFTNDVEPLPRTEGDI